MQPIPDEDMDIYTDSEEPLYEHPPIETNNNINIIEQTNEISHLVSLFDSEPLAATPGGSETLTDCSKVCFLIYVFLSNRKNKQKHENEASMK